jgi:hypothetical protein
MAGTIIADRLEAASTSQMVIENGVANTPPTIVDVNGTQIGTFCRAWVNFNGTGTVAIRASFNVSSITDGGTGIYTVNLTNAISDANYSICISAGDSANSFPYALLGSSSGATSLTTTSFKVYGRSTATQTLQDQEYICVSVFR